MRLITYADTQGVYPAQYLTNIKADRPTESAFYWKFKINEVITADVYQWGEFVFVYLPARNCERESYYGYTEERAPSWVYAGSPVPVECDPPADFKIEVIGNAYHKIIKSINPAYKTWQEKYRYQYHSLNKEPAPSEFADVEDYYLVEGLPGKNENRYGNSYDYRTFIPHPFFYLKLNVTFGSESKEIEKKFTKPNFGGTIDLDLKCLPSEIRSVDNFYGMQLEHKIDISEKKQSYYIDAGWDKFRNLLTLPIKQTRFDLWDRYFTSYFTSNEVSEGGIKAAKTNKEVKPNLSRIAAEEPVLHRFLLWLQDGKVSNKISNNSLLSAMLLSAGKDYDKLKEELLTVMKTVEATPNKFGSDRRDICLLFSAAKEKDNTRREQHEWYLRKSNGAKAEGLGVDPKKHPKFYAAVSEGKIPLTVFHNPGKQLELVNVEFDLWEKAYERGWGEELSSIANNASRRSTYDKKITAYISFLFKIESYLNRLAPMKKKPWRAAPKFVSTQWELEMEEVEEGQTAKRRSALTPLADNEERTITVPYAGIAIHGRQTTYCYSNEYYVFEANMIEPEGGGVIVNDVEKKLNGRDDYGLMFYTLDGTPRNQGHPTFLIIFEQRSTGPYVHFHRVHPSRSKNGVPVPACRLVEECYRYMAGNVRAEEICGQQGDLMFIKTDSSAAHTAEAKAILDFESHAFVAKDGSQILLSGNSNKSVKNRLGYIHASFEFQVQHPEHEWLTFEAGVYEVRRAKSFEANPVAVWSYTID